MRAAVRFARNGQIATWPSCQIKKAAKQPEACPHPALRATLSRKAGEEFDSSPAWGMWPEGPSDFGGWMTSSGRWPVEIWLPCAPDSAVDTGGRLVITGGYCDPHTFALHERNSAIGPSPFEPQPNRRAQEKASIHKREISRAPVATCN
jgi:hypothetical protein